MSHIDIVVLCIFGITLSQNILCILKCCEIIICMWPQHKAKCEVFDEFCMQATVNTAQTNATLVLDTLNMNFTFGARAKPIPKPPWTNYFCTYTHTQSSNTSISIGGSAPPKTWAALTPLDSRQTVCMIRPGTHGRPPHTRIPEHPELCN